jgi:hypothetical protein
MLVNISRYTYHLQKELDSRNRRTLFVNPATISSLSPSASPPFVENPDLDPVEDSQDPDEIAEKQLLETLQKLSLQEQLPRKHFGMSSHIVLMQTLLDYKQVATGRKQNMFRTGRRLEYWNVQPVNMVSSIAEAKSNVERSGSAIFHIMKFRWFFQNQTYLTSSLAFISLTLKYICLCFIEKPLSSPLRRACITLMQDLVT